MWDAPRQALAGAWVPDMKKYKEALLDATTMLESSHAPSAGAAAPAAVPAAVQAGGAQLEVQVFAQNLARSQVKAVDLPEGRLDHHLTRLQEFLTRVNDKKELFGGCGFDPVEFARELFAAFVDMINTGICWQDVTCKTDFISRTNIVELFHSCIWRSSYEQTTTSGDRDVVTFHWVLQSARRSGDEQLITYHEDFWSKLNRWNGRARNFRDIVCSYFVHCTQLPESFEEMGSLYRGAALSPEAADFFDRCFNDSTGVVCHQFLSTTRKKDVAMKFIQEQTEQAEAGQVLTLFEITRFLYTATAHVDLRMMGEGKKQKTEEEIVLCRPYFQKVTHFHPTVEQTDRGMRYTRIVLELWVGNRPGDGEEGAPMCEWI